MNTYITRLFLVVLGVSLFFAPRPTFAVDQPLMRDAIAALREAKTATDPLALLQKAEKILKNAEHDKGGYRIKAMQEVHEAIEADKAGDKTKTEEKIDHAISDVWTPTRLKYWREKFQLTPDQAAKVFRINKGRYMEYEGGREANNFFREKFSILENESPTIIFQLASMLHDEGHHNLKENPLAYEVFHAPHHGRAQPGSAEVKIHWIPVISWALAGRSLEADFSDVVDWDKKIPTSVRDPNAIAVRIRGDSMEPKISEGDTVILLCSEEPQNGEVVVARLKDGGVLCKIFHTKRAGNIVILTSYNHQAYPAQEHSIKDFHWIYPVGYHIVNKPLRQQYYI